MLTLAILETLALTNAQRGATPTGHALLFAALRAKAIESMHALLEAEADDDDA